MARFRSGLSKRLSNDNKYVRAKLSQERQQGAFLENLAIYEHLTTPARAEIKVADEAAASATRLRRTLSAPSILVPVLSPEQMARRKELAMQRKAAAEKVAAEAMDVADRLTAEVVAALANDLAREASEAPREALTSETEPKRPATPKAVRVHRARAGQSANMQAMFEKLDRERLRVVEDELQQDQLLMADVPGSSDGDHRSSSGISPLLEQATLFDRERSHQRSQRSTAGTSPWMLDMDLISRIRDGIGVYGGAHEWKLRHEGEWKRDAARHSL